MIKAIIDWCMVFGADSNELHWKKVVLDDYYRNEFLDYLNSIAGIDKTQFNRYWEEITDFRNKYATHRNFSGAYPPVPFMDKAYSILTCYDAWLRTKIDAEIEEPFLRERYERLLITPEKLLRDLLIIALALSGNMN